MSVLPRMLLVFQMGQHFFSSADTKRVDPNEIARSVSMQSMRCNFFSTEG